MGDKKSLILGWPCGHHVYQTVAVPQSVTKSKSYQWNSEIDPTLKDLVHSINKEGKINKKGKMF